NKQQQLDDQAVALFAQIPEVEAVVPFIEVSGMLAAGKYIAHMEIQGIDPGQMDKLNLTTGQGRLLEGGDNLNVLFGAQIQNFFHNPRARSHAPAEIDLMKDKLTLSLDMFYGRDTGNDDGRSKKPLAYTVKGIGILEEGNYEYNYSVFMPLEPLKKMVRDYNRSKKPSEAIKLDGYSKILVKVKNINDVQRVQQQIKDMGFYADSLTDILESMQKTAAGIQRVLGAIGAVALLVAAIGITNTMVMSIYERTREIGVMKVIGASLGDIRKLFLFESGMIGFFGGVVGVAFSYGVSYLLNTTGFVLFDTGRMQGGAGNTSIIPLWLAASALAFSSLIGLISGYYPARRAMNLSALEAIKKE
ncbi:MAG: FtsX-like permease family protein, partial [Firmicutes bacterium]|nr:FtsX-like permease family protein [Bacillota bacterium]